MKKIECITRPMKLDQIKDALAEIGVIGMTVSEVRGCGKQRGRTEKYRGTEYVVSLLPKIKVEIVVPDDIADRAIQVITENARTGEIGDGKIFITHIDDAIRIRTGERGPEAL